MFLFAAILELEESMIRGVVLLNYGIGKLFEGEYYEMSTKIEYVL